jgi:bacterioferritin-associated ferredoxin
MIPSLPRAYVEHLVAPRRTGDVADAEAAGEVGSMVGGLGVRVTLAYRDAGRGRAVIARAAVRSFGSASPVAPGSVVAGMLVGLGPTEAGDIGVPAVLRVLSDGSETGAGLPPRVVKATEFVVEAARRALGVPGRAAPADPRGPGILVCRCLDVGDRTIRRAIQHGARSAEAVGDACAAAVGCRSCRPDVLRILDEETHPAEPTPPAHLHPVERIAWVYVRPLLRSLGIGLDRVAVVDGTVRMGVSPRVERPDTTTLGATALSRHLLREIVADDIRVELEEVPRSPADDSRPPEALGA